MSIGQEICKWIQNVEEEDCGGELSILITQQKYIYLKAGTILSTERNRRITQGLTEL